MIIDAETVCSPPSLPSPQYTHVQHQFSFYDPDIHHQVWDQQGDGLASSCCSREVKGFQSVVQRHTYHPGTC